MRFNIHLLQNLFCAFFVTLIFSFRWSNCLPFSGFMPVIQNTDNLGFWGRYLIYAREPISFPLGTIKNLSFPFQSANITRGSIPLFAFSFKLLSKIFPLFAEFYYFPLVELIAVFAVGYYTCLILDEYKTDFFLIKLLAAVLTSLSFPLLFRSSNYFGATVHVFYFPLYMAFGYYYLLLSKKVNFLSLLKLLGVFILVGLTEYYVLLALLLILIFCLGFNLWNFWLLKNQLNKQRLILYSLLLIFVVILVFEGVYYLSLRVKKTGIKPSPLAIISPEINQKLNEAQEKFKQDTLALQNQSPEPQAASACLKEFFDPKTKADERIPVDPEKKIYDYGYNGYLTDFGEINSNGCNYWRVKLKARQGKKEYELLFPKGMILTDKSVGQISGGIFKNYLGSEIQVRLRYQEIELGVWQLQEWNFLRFFIKK